MNSNKIIPLLGLLIVLILAIGSISAAETDMDSNSVGDILADIDSADEGTSVGEVDNSNLEISQADNSDSEDSLNAEDATDVDAIDDEISVTDKDSLKASNLGSTYTFKSSNYNTYFTSNGTIISGKLKAGDVLDCSGSFNKLTFIINIPLTFKSTDRTARFTNCNFKIIEGADGSEFSDLRLTMDKLDTPVFHAFNVSDITIANCDIFSNASKSYPILFDTVNNSKILNNKLQTTAYVTGWGHPSALVLSASHYNNISSNNVIVNDSNGIYLTGYLNGGNMGEGGGVNTHNTLFNNTVHSVRGIEWAIDDNGKVPIPSSFCYAIQVMGANNVILNNTVYNAYRGISATQSGNKIIGNNVSRIHGTWYSGNTNDTGGDYAIYAGTNAVVKENIVSDCIINESGAAVSAGRNSNITNNVFRNITGNGMELSANNILASDNEINVTKYGVHTLGNYSGVVISNNIIDSGNQSAIKLEKKSRQAYPHDFIIQNNDLHSTATKVIDVDPACTNIILSNNTGDSGSEPTDDEVIIRIIRILFKNCNIYLAWRYFMFKKKLITILCFFFIFIIPTKVCYAFDATYVWSSIPEEAIATSTKYADTNSLKLESASAVLMEQNTGKVLYNHNIHEKLRPASVTKVMTILLIMEAIDSGRIKYTDKVPCSEKAASMGGSQIWLDTKEELTVDEMLKAICVVSANDCTVAMAEFLAGSEEAFVEQMNEKAKKLGMSDTTFKNSHGIDEDGHVTSSYDIALMSRELMKNHPNITKYTTIWMDSLRDGKSELVSTNKLIRNYNGITGVKTGSTSLAS